MIKRIPHTVAYDRGRVQSVTATSVTLKERDGSVWTIGVGPSTKVTIDGVAATIAQVRPLEQATTMAVDGGAATFVRVQIPPALAAALARQARRRARLGGLIATRHTVRGIVALVLGVLGGYFASKAWIEAP